MGHTALVFKSQFDQGLWKKGWVGHKDLQTTNITQAGNIEWKSEIRPGSFYYIKFKGLAGEMNLYMNDSEEERSESQKENQERLVLQKARRWDFKEGIEWVLMLEVR